MQQSKLVVTAKMLGEVVGEEERRARTCALLYEKLLLLEKMMLGKGLELAQTETSANLNGAASACRENSHVTDQKPTSRSKFPGGDNTASRTCNGPACLLQCLTAFQKL